MLKELNLIYKLKVKIKKTLNIFLKRPVAYGREIYKRPWDFPEIMLLEYLYQSDRKQNLFLVGVLPV